ncbi:MAG TPA: Ig-like domain-containing protein [Myxococcales bacterium]|jgi:hypothetical protein
MRRIVVSSLIVAAAALAACTDQPFTVDVGLRVVSVSPSGAAVGVGRRQPVVVTFSEALDPGTVTADSVSLATEDGAAVTGALTYDGVYAVTLQPDKPLAYSAHYRITLTTDLKRKRDASPLSVKVTSLFKTEDPPPLRLIASIPSGGSVSFDRAGTIRLVFSEPVRCSTLEKGALLTQAFDPHPRTEKADEPVAGTWDCREPSADSPDALEGPANCPAADPSLCTVTFKPTDPAFAFEWSSRVTIALAGGKDDPAAIQSFRATADGGWLEAPLDLTFRVQDPPALALTSVVPAAGATGVDRATSITLNFSEPVRCQTLLDAAVVAVSDTLDPHPRIAGASGPLSGAWKVGGAAIATAADCPTAADYACKPGAADDPCVAVFTPSAPLEWSTQIELKLAGGLYEPGKAPAAERLLSSTRVTSYGGTLVTSAAWSFRIVDPPALALTAVSPAAGATGVPRAPSIALTFSEPVRCQTLLNPAVVSLLEQPDPHPTLGGPARPIAGGWKVGGVAVAAAADCPAPADYACKPGAADDPCVAVFTPSAALGWSSVVKVTLAGGAYAPGVAPAAESFLSSTRVTTRGGTLSDTVAYSFRVDDPPPVLVLSVTPGTVAGDLRTAPATLLRDQSIVVTLSEPVSCQTVNDATVKVTEDLDPTDAVAALDVPVAVAECAGAPPGSTSPTLTLTRTAGSWSYSAVVKVTLAGGPFGQDAPAAWPRDAFESAIATTFGGQLLADHSFTLVVEDPPPLRVLYTTPASGTKGAPLSGPIEVVFNQPVRIASLAPAGVDLTRVNAFDRTARARGDLAAADLPHCAVACPDADGDGASDLIDPAQPSLGSRCTCTPTLAGAPFAFDLSSEVEGAVAASVTGALGTWRAGALGSAYPFHFRTVDPRPLLVASTSPGDHDTSVPPVVYCDASGACSASPAASPTMVQRKTGVRVRFDRAFDCGSTFGATAAGPNTVLLEDLSELDASGNPTLVTGSAQCLDEAGAASATAAVSLLFIPDAELAWDHQMRLTVKRADIAADAASAASNTGARSRDWTDWAAEDSGTLVGGDLVVRFQVARKPLEIVSTKPVNNAQNAPPFTLVSLTFNQPVACDATNDQLQTGFGIVGGAGTGALSVSFSCADYDPATYTATYTVQDANAPAGQRLVPGTTYTVTMLGGALGPHDVSGRAYLYADYVFKFTVSSNELRGYEIPSDGATGVAPDQVVCEVFSGTLANASPAGLLSVSFTDCTGRTVQVQGALQFWSFPDAANHPLTGAPTSSPGSVAGNAVCLVPSAASYDCFTEPQKLPYATTFTATVSGAKIGAIQLQVPFNWTFRTADPPQVARAAYVNEVVDEPLRPALGPVLDAQGYPLASGGTPVSVPVNSQLVLGFASPLLVSSVAGAAITLAEKGGGSPLALCPAAVTAPCLKASFSQLANGDPAKPQVVTLTPTGPAGPVNLKYASAYSLKVKGGVSGVTVVRPGTPDSTTALSSHLPGDLVYPFVTSPATRVEINPGSDLTNTTPGASVQWQIFPDEEIPLVFSRPIRLSSANTRNIYGRDPAQTPTLMSGIVALNADDVRSAVLVPSPTFTKSIPGMAVIATTGVQDYRGNPMPLGASADAADPLAALKSTFNAGNTPSLSSQIPLAIACASVAPNNGGTCAAVAVQGDQELVVTFGASQSQANRFLPSSFNPSSVSLAAAGGAGCPASGTAVPVTVRYEIARAVADGDRLHVTPAQPLAAGCSYTLTLTQARFANVYNLGNLAAAVTVGLVVETVAPVLLSQEPPAAAVNVAGDAALAFTFDENLSLAVPAGAVAVKEALAGTPVPGALSLGPNAAGTCSSCVATFVPLAYAAGPGVLQHGVGYSVSLSSALRDVAGNPYAGSTSSFTVESTPPAVAAVPTVVADTPTPGQRTIAVHFTEAVDPATLVADAFDATGALAAAGTVRLVDAGGAAVAGCVWLDASDASRRTVLLATTDNSVAPGAYTLLLPATGPAGQAAGGVTDMAGNRLAVPYQQAVSF